jgi:hypothetical protein
VERELGLFQLYQFAFVKLSFGLWLYHCTCAFAWQHSFIFLSSPHLYHFDFSYLILKTVLLRGRWSLHRQDWGWPAGFLFSKFWPPLFFFGKTVLPFHLNLLSMVQFRTVWELADRQYRAGDEK